LIALDKWSTPSGEQNPAYRSACAFFTWELINAVSVLTLIFIAAGSDGIRRSRVTFKFTVQHTPFFPIFLFPMAGKNGI
jgi:hypothetical protein